MDRVGGYRYNGSASDGSSTGPVRSSGLRDLLAANLRQLCEQQPSIASVCRALGINRQQFNNYLSARNLPNETVVRQLCEFFQIEPYELFLPPSQRRYDRQLLDAIASFAERSLGKQYPNDELPVPGSYFVYFEAPFEPTALVRSYMQTGYVGQVLTFTRVTSVPVNATNELGRAFNRHEGFVYTEGDDIHWSGYNVRGRARPSLLVGRRIRTPPVLYAGIGLIDTGNRTETAGFAVTRAPPMSMPVMRSLGLVTVADTPATRIAGRAIEGYRRSFSLSYSSFAQR